MKKPAFFFQTQRPRTKNIAAAPTTVERTPLDSEKVDATEESYWTSFLKKNNHLDNRFWEETSHFPFLHRQAQESNLIYKVSSSKEESEKKKTYLREEITGSEKRRERKTSYTILALFSSLFRVFIVATFPPSEKLRINSKPPRFSHP